MKCVGLDLGSYFPQPLSLKAGGSLPFENPPLSVQVRRLLAGWAHPRSRFLSLLARARERSPRPCAVLGCCATSTLEEPPTPLCPLRGIHVETGELGDGEQVDESHVGLLPAMQRMLPAQENRLDKRLGFLEGGLERKLEAKLTEVTGCRLHAMQLESDRKILRSRQPHR